MIKHLCKLVWNRKRINFLITVEVFLSFIVVFAVVVFAVYYTNNYRQPLGFNYDRVWRVGVNTNVAGEDQAQPEQVATAWRMLAAVREFAEVEAAAGVWGAPYSRGDWTGDRKLKDGSYLEFGQNRATDELPDVLGLKIVRGRWFSKEDDGAINYQPVVINQRVAQALFNEEDPLGKDISNPDDKERKEQRVIGVIDDFRNKGEFAERRGYVFTRNAPTDARADIPYSFLLKVRPGTTAAFEEKLLARLQAEAKDWSFEIKPLDEMRASIFQEYLVPIAAFALVAGFLLLMVGLGLTGVLWLNVTQRTKEIGLRRAKGATRRRIYRQILGELLIITTFGLLVGVLVVVQFPLLNFLGFADWQVYATSIIISLALIYLLTIVCGLYPSRLATKVQPAEALHYE